MILDFIHFFDEFSPSKQNSPRWDAANAASHLGLFCLPKRTIGLNELNKRKWELLALDIFMRH